MFLALAPHFVLLLFALSSASSLSATLNGCSKLINGQMLDFVNPGGIRLMKSNGGNCERLLSCDVIGAPAERTNVHWYINGRKMHSTTGGPTLKELTEYNMENEFKGPNAIGVGEVSHRLCADNWMVEGMGLYRLVPEMEFRCVASLDCGEQYIESAPLLVVGTIGRRRRTATAVRELLASLGPSTYNKRSPIQPPLISMITSSRMELTGLPLRIACAANGVPKPRISWDVVGMDGIGLDRPIPASEFPFVTEWKNNGQLVINSSNSLLHDVASISFRCTANNSGGEDSAKSLVVLLNDARR